MLLPLAGLLVGVAAGLLLNVNVSFELARYSAVAIVAALDSVLGAVRAELDGVYDNRIFISGFVTNASVAVLFTFIGDRLGLDLYLVALITFATASLFQEDKQGYVNGLTSMVDDELILSTVEKNRTDLRRAAKALISAANKRGGEDNITVVFFEIAEDHGEPLEKTATYPQLEGDGHEPFCEDEWLGGTLVFGDNDAAPAVRVTLRDERCVMINLDPETAARDARSHF